MESRKNFVGGNWKSNNTRAQTQELIQNTLAKLEFDATKVGSLIFI